MLSLIKTSGVTLRRCRVNRPTRQRLFQPRYTATSQSVEQQHNNSVLLHHLFNSQDFSSDAHSFHRSQCCNRHAIKIPLPGSLREVDGDVPVPRGMVGKNCANWVCFNCQIETHPNQCADEMHLVCGGRQRTAANRTLVRKHTRVRRPTETHGSV